ncbi:MAG: FtsX-like permease family protein [Lachnospiraceae bacterium]|nr:FtsX-like permease family protein [Lachnospiraceae bacterium]
MLKVMFQKIWHKRWMVFSLLLGSILLSATVVSFPMYKKAAFDRMLQDEFYNYLTEKGEWPGLLKFTMVSKKDAEGKSIQRMKDLMNSIYKDMGVTERETLAYYSLATAEVKSEMQRDDVGDINIRLSSMTNLPEHAEMLAGEMFSEDGLSDDGCIEVVISQSCMVNTKVLVGESLTFTALKHADGKPIRIKVVGIYDKKDSTDFYWQVSPEQMNNVFLMKDSLFEEYFHGANAKKYTITCNYFPMFEYEDCTAKASEKLYAYTTDLVENSVYRSTVDLPGYLEVLENFNKKQDRIEATLFILQIPVLILLCAFLFMIASQMYDMERNEISVLKSRGGSGSQILRLYFYQSVFTTLIGTVLGLQLGKLFCGILGSARNFLEFNLSTELNVEFTEETLQYALVAATVSILVMTLPALKHSRLTIVKLKQQKATRSKALWEKLFLDVICLGVALYGYYSFSKNQELLAVDVLKGEALDPLLYLSSSLFIVGLGLLFLRLQPYVIKLIYGIGKSFWGPASYASFIENIKNNSKQHFIMLFMILTVALGMYHATVARTILQNAKDNVAYLEGADLIVKEIWTDNSALASQAGAGEFQYFEPDYNKYAKLDFVESYTRVIFDEGAYLKGTKNTRQDITLMGIHTKEFGGITHVDSELLEKEYYEYLNELAVEANGVLVSRNFATKLDYKVGDSITFYGSLGKPVHAKIIDFVDYWPGYEPVTTTLNADGSVSSKDNFYLIAHYQVLRKNWGVTPYEVWMSLKDGASADQIASWLEENDVHLAKYMDKDAEIEKVVQDPLLQGTNGVLTMSFMVTLVLCAAGYLIYWIMSIRSREMIFGVLRASGMHKGEVFHMLINEQIFSGLTSILAGVGIGKLTSKMFVPMIQSAYAAADQVLPMKLITNPMDMVRLYGVVAAVMVVCLAVLILLVFKMNIAKALKLGEE